MTITRQLTFTLIPASTIIAAIAVTSILLQIEIPLMTRDVTAIADIHPLSGILSTLGIMLWCATAAICFFSAAIVHKSNHPHIYKYLLGSAVLSTYLMLDDAFLFHEGLAPNYIGLNEKVVFFGLGVSVFILFFTNRHVILKTNYKILLLALSFLCISVIIDTILQPWLWRIGHWEFFFEDGAKWLGICCWCSYYVSTCHQSLLKMQSQTRCS